MLRKVNLLGGRGDIGRVVVRNMWYGGWGKNNNKKGHDVLSQIWAAETNTESFPSTETKNGQGGTPSGGFPDYVDVEEIINPVYPLSPTY